MTIHMMRRPSLCGLLATAFLVGCGAAERGSAGLTVPDLGPAQAALVASLDAWKADLRGSGVVIGSKPAIGVVDSARADRPLLDYEVVGPLMVQEKIRPFSVRLVLGSPRETVTARYLVMGRDPLWVYRQEDFDLMIHWEHKMAPGEGREGTDGR
jgi:hypothetical protein